MASMVQEESEAFPVPPEERDADDMDMDESDNEEDKAVEQAKAKEQEIAKEVQRKFAESSSMKIKKDYVPKRGFPGPTSASSLYFHANSLDPLQFFKPPPSLDTPSTRARRFRTTSSRNTFGSSSSTQSGARTSKRSTSGRSSPACSSLVPTFRPRFASSPAPVPTCSARNLTRPSARSRRRKSALVGARRRRSSGTVTRPPRRRRSTGTRQAPRSTSRSPPSTVRTVLVLRPPTLSDLLSRLSRLQGLALLLSLRRPVPPLLPLPPLRAPSLRVLRVRRSTTPTACLLPARRSVPTRLLSSATAPGPCRLAAPRLAFTRPGLRRLPTRTRVAQLRLTDREQRALRGRRARMCGLERRRRATAQASRRPKGHGSKSCPRACTTRCAFSLLFCLPNLLLTIFRITLSTGGRLARCQPLPCIDQAPTPLGH